MLVHWDQKAWTALASLSFAQTSSFVPSTRFLGKTHLDLDASTVPLLEDSTTTGMVSLVPAKKLFGSWTILLVLIKNLKRCINLF